MIQEYIRTQTVGFGRDEIDITVSWGGENPMKICISPYKPSSHSEEYAGYQARDGRNLGVESLPVGLVPNGSFTEKILLEQLELMIETQEGIIGTSPSRNSNTSRNALDAVLRFHKLTKSVSVTPFIIC
jgi:hypothetical protein